MPTTRANGVGLHYELTGDGPETLVLIHGSWNDSSIWDMVIAGLSSDLRVLRYDRRGHGKSEKAHTQGSCEEDAMDAAALIKELHLGHVHVMGSSFGGNVALRLAAREPRLFKSLMVQEPPMWGLLPDDPAIQREIKERRERWAGVAERLAAGDDE